MTIHPELIALYNPAALATLPHLISAGRLLFLSILDGEPFIGSNVLFCKSPTRSVETRL